MTLSGPDSHGGELLDLVYEHLRAIATRRMEGERSDHTLQATALVHEAYLKVAPRLGADVHGRTQFLNAAAAAMRRILVDHARSRGRTKRGRGAARLPLDVLDLATASATDSGEIMALDEALHRLGERDARAATIVELRFFAGLGIDETAAAVGVSPRTVKREWTVARAWLQRELARSRTDYDED